MKCIITRTSLCGLEDQPHPMAYQQTFSPGFKDWCIDIEDIFKFVDDYGGEIILYKNSTKNSATCDGYPDFTIEIYDDYRE